MPKCCNTRMCMVCEFFFFLISYCEQLSTGCQYFSLLSHPTSCCSMAELMSVLFFNTMRYKVEDPRNQCNDRFVLSKVGIHFFSKDELII